MNRAALLLCVGALTLTADGVLLAQPGAPTVPPDKAIITVLVRGDATVTIGGQVSAQTGTERRFITGTPLVPGSRYSYDVVATWKEDGKERKDKRTVKFQAGSTTVVNFTQPAPAPGEKKTKKQPETKTPKKQPETKSPKKQPETKSPTAQSFFNGRNLDGWEGLPDYWTVKDGAIVGSTKAVGGGKFNTFLCSKHKYKDFELHFQVKLTESGNSGIQIRSKIADAKTLAVAGPQADMGGPYWGSLYGERFGGMMKQADGKLVQKVLKKNDFNDYYIKCSGDHVTIKLNGATTVDGDFAKMPEEGIIAFQLHAGPPMEVTFKDIQFKELNKK